MKRLRVALDSAHFGTFDLNPVTGDLGWDAQMKRIWGIQPNAEINLEEALRRIHPDDQKRVNDIVNTVLAADANGDYEAEYRLVWPDGTVHWSSAKGRVYFQGEGEQRHPVRFIGVQRDITEAKHIEEALRESEQRFRALAENVPQMVWVADAAANFRYVSPKWLEYTGTIEEQNANGGGSMLSIPKIAPQAMSTGEGPLERAAITIRNAACVGRMGNFAGI